MGQVDRVLKNRQTPNENANVFGLGWGGRIRTFDRLIQSQITPQGRNRPAKRRNGASGQAPLAAL